MEIKDKILNKMLEINRAFYNAFVAGDFLAVKEIWATDHQISVVHLGSAVLHGQKAVMMIWKVVKAISN